MNLRLISFVAMSVCAPLLVCVGVGSAAEEGAKSADHATEIFKWINFGIVALGVVWLFAKKLPPVFRAKAELIGAAITKASAIKAEADRQLADAESRLARLDQEVIALQAAAAKEAAADAERIRELAKSDAEKVSLAADAEIEAAERAARVELKSLAAKLAVDGAEALLVKQLTAQAQESLVNGFVESLEGRPN